ncbi:MAG: hypothetical protein HY735_13445 [Verrucomicrobia bacterium]|nr:hypothetical protein [Verrucomicrobiota bacterium]
MQLLFDDELIESVVFLCASGKSPGVASLQIRRFHAERERAYSVLDPDERNAAFSRIHRAWFREWGVEQCLLSALAEFPILEKSVHAAAFRTARRKNEEGAELYVNAAGERHAIVAVRSERFADRQSLLAFLRHELMHVSDMVAPAFGYSREMGEAGQTASQLRVVRERYRLLWDITIDGRLTRSNRCTVAAFEERRSEFDRAYGFLDAAKRSAVFDSHWNAVQPRHRDLILLASDPRRLNASNLPVPGAPCPLCDFATFEWAELRALKSETANAIQKDFPGWTVEQGACFRCAEIYEAARGLELPPTVCL